MSAPWPSTKGMSVFNALKFGGNMTPQQITAYLRRHWDPQIEQAYVNEGLDFIRKKGWISSDGDEVKLSIGGNDAFSVERDANDADLRLVRWSP
jgi:hypothetical protein